MSTIIESYKLFSEYKRVIGLVSGGYFVTKLKIYDDGNGNFHPSWQHSVFSYVDTNPQNDPKILLGVWEAKIMSAQSEMDFKLYQDY